MLSVHLLGGEIQVNISPYYDSNIRESFQLPESTYGLKLSGRLTREWISFQSSTAGTLIGQNYLDVIFPKESKLIIKGELNHNRKLYRRINFLGQGSYFRKNFFNSGYYYSWWETGLFLQLPKRSFIWSSGYRHRSTSISSAEKNRFRREAVEIRGQYYLKAKLYLVGSAGAIFIAHEDFKAREVLNDTLLTVLQIAQRDRGYYGSLHLRYQGNFIYGAQASVETVSSNSVIGNYHFLSLRLYLTGRWGQKTFYHLVLQQMDKSYRNSNLKDVIQYRDPEELMQNRSYARIEYNLEDNLLGYVQVSFLKNETLLNQTYYSKTLLEAGFKFNL
ncbi:MAG: hypothetical protein V3S48_05375 [Candidatus Neomarinimicrobiota bacterium]